MFPIEWPTFKLLMEDAEDSIEYFPSFLGFVCSVSCLPDFQFLGAQNNIWIWYERTKKLKQGLMGWPSKNGEFWRSMVAWEKLSIVSKNSTAYKLWLSWIMRGCLHLPNRSGCDRGALQQLFTFSWRHWELSQTATWMKTIDPFMNLRIPCRILQGCVFWPAGLVEQRSSVARCSTIPCWPWVGTSEHLSSHASRTWAVERVPPHILSQII